MDTVAQVLDKAGWHREPDHTPVNEPPRQVYSHGIHRCYVAPKWAVFYERHPDSIENIQSVKTDDIGAVAGKARIQPPSRPAKTRG
jgi:hypothetical protein